ncbi:hypothetical protein J4573_16320 [Actinomadura barringtoniae]|uniref:Uncharacterized protein n=1 Tax=Actinomadura barringtoniae TaxID=1427535 RepID=A0A939PEJ0_9ACTN|nr:hypothetical protein [Actinomadura barringtoniae]MBO2448668.1 hypothetical protein [Actinomadura barringtoniae]
MEPSNPLRAVTSSEVLAIAHRQWMRANRIKSYFTSALAETDEAVRSDPGQFYVSDAGIFVLTWYGLLFSVLERLREKGVDLTGLDPNINELYNALRRLRNSVFHAENHYWDNRQLELMALSDVVTRINYVHATLGEYFLDAVGPGGG